MNLYVIEWSTERRPEIKRLCRLLGKIPGLNLVATKEKAEVALVVLDESGTGGVFDALDHFRENRPVWCLCPHQAELNSNLAARLHKQESNHASPLLAVLRFEFIPEAAKIVKGLVVLNRRLGSV